jgi:hypothetical protein
MNEYQQKKRATSMKQTQFLNHHQGNERVSTEETSNVNETDTISQPSSMKWTSINIRNEQRQWNRHNFSTIIKEMNEYQQKKRATSMKQTQFLNHHQENERVSTEETNNVNETDTISQPSSRKWTSINRRNEQRQWNRHNFSTIIKKMNESQQKKRATSMKQTQFLNHHQGNERVSTAETSNVNETDTISQPSSRKWTSINRRNEQRQ